MFLWGGDLERSPEVSTDKGELDWMLIASPFVVVLSAYEVRARPLMMSEGMEGVHFLLFGGRTSSGKGIGFPVSLI